MLKVRTFSGKTSMEGLHQMDNHINEWLERTRIVPLHIKQSFGSERHHGQNDEPVVIVSIWFERKDDF